MYASRARFKVATYHNILALLETTAQQLRVCEAYACNVTATHLQTWVRHTMSDVLAPQNTRRQIPFVLIHSFPHGAAVAKIGS
jgi:hypothetical protein